VKLDKASGKYEELEQLEQDAEGIRRDIAKAEGHALKLAGAPKDLRQAKKDERTARAALRGAKAKVEALQKTRGQLNKSLGGPQSQCDRVKKALGQIKKEGSSGQCPTCYRELGDTYEEILAHLQEELTKHQADLDKAQKDLEQVDAELADWTAKSDAAEDLVSNAAQAINKAGVNQQKLSNAKKQLADLLRLGRRNEARQKTLRRIDYDPKRHDEANSEYQRLARIHGQIEALRKTVGREPAVKRSLSVALKRIASTEAALAKARSQRNAIGFDRAAYDAAKKEEDGANAVHRKTAVALADARGELKRLQELFAAAQQMVKDLRLQKERIAKDEEHVRYLERLEAVLKDFREWLAARVKPEIEQYASVLLNQVTAGRYPRIELDEYYGISLNDGTETYPLRRFSGGEEDLANLCLRLAISQVVSSRLSGDDSSLVVLDEVFGSQDEERRQNILQALVRLSETFQQVVLITHTEDINDRVPMVLRVTENAAREAQAVWL
jgi:exonuclease SbcC